MDEKYTQKVLEVIILGDNPLKITWKFSLFVLFLAEG
jgi:hypothetical protein